MAKIRNFKQKPLSPYAKHGKAPFRYSDETRALVELVKKTGTSRSARGRELIREHARKFGYSEPAREAGELPIDPVSA